jgi:hypothetical protein
MHLHDLFVVDALGWWVCLKAKGWLGLVDVAAGGGGVRKVRSMYSPAAVDCIIRRSVRPCQWTSTPLRYSKYPLA